MPDEIPGGNELRQNARRNHKEFSYEGWKWEDVLEEADMFVDKLSNEYIHPVHLGGLVGMR